MRAIKNEPFFSYLPYFAVHGGHASELARWRHWLNIDSQSVTRKPIFRLAAVLWGLTNLQKRLGWGEAADGEAAVHYSERMNAITYTAARKNLASTMDRVCNDHSPRHRSRLGSSGDA